MIEERECVCFLYGGLCCESTADDREREGEREREKEREKGLFSSSHLFLSFAPFVFISSLSLSLACVL